MTGRLGIFRACACRIWRWQGPTAIRSISASSLAAPWSTPIRGFRDHFAELRKAGVDHVYGLSTQDSAYQREAAERLHLPFLLLSDKKLALARALKLPTFVVDGMTLLKRLTLMIDGGLITHVFYPVFPPDKSAAETLAWLTAKPS